MLKYLKSAWLQALIFFVNEEPLQSYLSFHKKNHKSLWIKRSLSQFAIVPPTKTSSQHTVGKVSIAFRRNKKCLAFFEIRVLRKNYRLKLWKLSIFQKLFLIKRQNFCLSVYNAFQYFFETMGYHENKSCLDYLEVLGCIFAKLEQRALPRNWFLCRFFTQKLQCQFSTKYIQLRLLRLSTKYKKVYLLQLFKNYTHTHAHTHTHTYIYIYLFEYTRAHYDIICSKVDFFLEA